MFSHEATWRQYCSTARVNCGEGKLSHAGLYDGEPWEEDRPTYEPERLWRTAGRGGAGFIGSADISCRTVG